MATTGVAEKKRILVDVHVRIDHGERRYRDDTDEQYAQRVERWARELREFMRDHRSQDPNSITVDREYREVCSCCGREWEEDISEEPPICANCGKEIMRTT